MNNYDISKIPISSEKLDLAALSACKLNDFDAFNDILFGKNVQPDFNKFFGGDLKQVYSDYRYTVAVPFHDPTTMVEYQINHYVMSGVIALLKVWAKPYYLVEYNTGDYLPGIENDCWCCEWSLRHEKRFFCENCPVWYSQGLFRFMCECTVEAQQRGKDGELLDGYVRWDDNCNEEEDYEQAAIDIQMYPWHVVTCTDDFDI